MSFIKSIIDNLSTNENSKTLIADILEIVNNDTESEPTTEQIDKIQKLLEATFTPSISESSSPVVEDTTPAFNDTADDTNISNENEDEDDNESIFKKAIATVEEILKERKCTYSIYSKESDLYIFKANKLYPNCKLGYSIYLEKDSLVCFVRIVLPISYDPAYLYPLCELLATLNYKNTNYPCFSINPKNKSVVSKIRFIYSGGLNKKNFEDMLFVALYDAAENYPEIARIASGKLNKEQKEKVLENIEILKEDINNY